MGYYAALVPLEQLLEDIIHRDRYPNILLDKQQIASLYEKFHLLQRLLDDYSPKNREAADYLEGRVRDAAYQAQDIIESQVSNKKSKTHGVERVFQHLISPLQKAILPCLFPMFFGLLPSNMEKGNQDLKKLNEEVDSIVEGLMRIKKSHTTEVLQPNYYSGDAGTSNQASGTNTMVGLEKRLTMVKQQLYGGPSKRRVVSIVGMGGMGKTTLARNIFYDGLMLHRFDCRVWITVSQDYHLKNILLDILDSMVVPIDKSSTVAELKVTIYKRLKGRRYLIIIDDIWDTKVWNAMKMIFPDDSNGSRIMITTRISDVALYADEHDFYHQMQFLNEDQSWNLFREKVSCPLELEDIGKLIASNCRGLPLAIVVVAGLLAKVSKKRSDWEEIARNVSPVVAKNDENFSRILSLSYNHLPYHLKPLFLYIGGFPKHYEIPISKLIKLWIAEGFIKPIESKSLEAIAEEYLEDLVNRNLVFITKKGSNGKNKCCGIHDLLRDLCMERVRYENFLHVLDEDDYSCLAAARNGRRLFICGDFPSQSHFIEAEEFGPHVRSIICHTDEWNFLLFGSGFKLLRVLDATTRYEIRFPAKILKHFHLRYLAFTADCIHNIPPSISLLQNLQTLIVKDHSRVARLCSLPSQIREMPNLRHIMSNETLRFECQFFGQRIICEPPILENLKTLSWVYNIMFTNEVIEMIPNLQKLKVFYDVDSGEWQKVRFDNLSHLCQLETLNIYFDNTTRHRNPLPQSFAFPLTLKKLSLRCCKIPWKDMTIVRSLPNLQVLKLGYNAFVGEMWELVEGEFPELKFLLLEHLELMYWQAESIHFPRLQHLKIRDCNKLKEIPPEIGEISTLELVEVYYSKLAAKSALEMQDKQRDMGNDGLQVRVYS